MTKNVTVSSLLSEEIFKIIRAFNFKAQMFDIDGNETIEPSIARRFAITKIDTMISIIEANENSTVNMYLGLDADIFALRDFHKALRNVSNIFNYLFSLRKGTESISPKSFAMKPSLSETKKYRKIKSKCLIKENHNFSLLQKNKDKIENLDGILASWLLQNPKMINSEICNNIERIKKSFEKISKDLTIVEQRNLVKKLISKTKI